VGPSVVLVELSEGAVVGVVVLDAVLPPVVLAAVPVVIDATLVLAGTGA
jgi:hypothetical protein